MFIKSVRTRPKCEGLLKLVAKLQCVQGGKPDAEHHQDPLAATIVHVLNRNAGSEFWIISIDYADKR